MIDVSPKFNTLRYAKAEGILFASEAIIQRIKAKRIPKGDVLQVARAAGIMAAKRTADWIVFCHPLPLDWVEISFNFDDSRLWVSAEVRAIWKTGVEMEALSAVSAALLNVYDMLKPLDDNIYFGDIKLVEKKGGKSSFIDKIEKTINVAVLVISDSTYAEIRKDKSGIAIKEFLQNQPVSIASYEILPDDLKLISRRLTALVDQENIDLIFTTGGTGIGPKDVTPEAIRKVIEKEIPGIAETIRRYGKERTPYAMLSREVVGIRKQSLIISLPGSTMGAKESMHALFPGLLHVFPMIWGGGHAEND